MRVSAGLIRVNTGQIKARSLDVIDEYGSERKGNGMGGCLRVRATR
jgi:hypothetical protein